MIRTRRAALAQSGHRFSLVTNAERVCTEIMRQQKRSGWSALRAQCLLQVRDQVLLVLDADREPHHVGAGARLDLGGVVELAVGGRGRMDDERAGVADIGRCENSCSFDTRFTPAW